MRLSRAAGAWHFYSVSVAPAQLGSLAGIQISASEPAEQFPSLFYGSGVGGGLGVSSENGCRGPSACPGMPLNGGRSSEASPQVGVCKNRSFQTDVAPSTRQWSRPLYIGRFSGSVVSRRLTLSLGVRKRRERRRCLWARRLGDE